MTVRHTRNTGEEKKNEVLLWFLTSNECLMLGIEMISRGSNMDICVGSEYNR
jgi:hypothetical protein